MLTNIDDVLRQAVQEAVRHGAIAQLLPHVQESVQEPRATVQQLALQRPEARRHLWKLDGQLLHG